MRVLFATGSPATYMAPPRLSNDQVICGPDWADQQDESGRWQSLSTPVGQYNLAEVASRLPADQQPDVVVCLVDASRRNLPRGLAAFRCPRVLLIADTHHLQSPLLGMLHYMTSEPYTRNVILYDRHHADIFRSAGVRNLFWFPGLTFPHDDAAVKAARKVRRSARIGFVGQSGRFHPRRPRLIDAMHAGRLPIVQKSLPQAAALGFYGESVIGFNASLNGDLNLRTFEVLAAGAALVTDRLADSSGLFALWTEGRELACYDGPDSLVEVARSLLAAPTEAQRMGTAGAEWFDAHFTQQHRCDGFRALAFDGRPFAECELPVGSGRVYFPGNTPRLLRTLMVYEGLQELHRTQEAVSVGIGQGVPGDITTLCATLPRLETRSEDELGRVDMAILGREVPDASTLSEARNIWCEFRDERAASELGARLAEAGMACINEKLALYQRSKPPVASPSSRLPTELNVVLAS